MTIFRAGCLALLMILAVILIRPDLAQAQMMDLSAIPELPQPDMPEAEFAEKTEEYKETPFGDQSLSYTLRLPKKWIKTSENSSKPTNLDNYILGDVARYYGPVEVDVRSSLVVRAVKLEREISAKNWFIHHTLVNGYTLQGIREINSRRVEGSYVYVEGDTTYVTRCVAEINGARIVLVMYSVPEQLWQKEKSLQAGSIRSFNLTSPETKKMETMRTYAFLDLLRFDYPSGWRLMAPTIYSIETMDAKLINSFDESFMNGEIDIHLISTELDTTLPEEVRTVKKGLDERGLKIGKLIEQPANFTLHNHIYFSRIEVYEANDKDNRALDHEYWIGVLMEDRYIYIVSMLTPSRRSAEFYTWAMNTEAFRQVVESLRP